jgi:hypothetical protein
MFTTNFNVKSVMFRPYSLFMKFQFFPEQTMIIPINVISRMIL